MATSRRTRPARKRVSSPAPAEPARDAVLDIVAVARQGDGLGFEVEPDAEPADIADTEPTGAAIYVPFTLPGERVRAQVSGTHATLTRVESPSPHRVAPPCPHFRDCGGCTLQHWARGPYLEWKRQSVVDALERAGVASHMVAQTINAAGSGRRRATFHAVRARAVGFVFGFARAASHELADITCCPVLDPRMAAHIEPLRQMAEAALAKPGRLDIEVVLSDVGLDVGVRGAGTLSPERKAVLAGLAREADWARLSVGDEAVALIRTPKVMLGDVAALTTPSTFLQATAAGEASLADLVLAALGPASVLTADLYAGIGTFTLRLAATRPVHAVEGDANAVAALKAAVRGVSGLKPVSATRRDLAREPLTGRELRRFGAIVLDPPRTGAEAQARQLAHVDTGRLAYVSCNPVSFARDAAILIAGGWRLDVVTPVDQFLWSAHVELVGAFSR